ncbi:hypothetical protein BD410DRAFT_780611 [Rickenella mellea]|uniref:Uncharacterized protein n=1 Tax=Rickenella mellea TaxID=50990 RepID=A0A4R5XHG4_9AGAM|nr:hypothetical protein BD410DRAFT_780611 [Rickenella mellea]
MERFGRIPVNPRETDFYGAFNMLLQSSSLFRVAGSDFSVGPQRADYSKTNVDSPFEFVVYYGMKPVFVLQINEPGRLSCLSERRSADRRMRSILEDLYPLCPISTLDGVCTFGTKLCFYRLDQQSSLFPSL